MAELRAMADPRLAQLLNQPEGAVDVNNNALIGHSAGALVRGGTRNPPRRG